MSATTANQQLPYPTSTDDPDVPSDMQALAIALEKKLVMVFTNTGDRSTRVPSPQAGMFSVITSTNKMEMYNGSTWVQVYPPVITITRGTVVPSNSSGVDGDVFLKF